MDYRKLIKIWIPDSHQKGFQEGFKISPRAAQKLGPQQLTDIIERFRRTGSVSPEKGLKTRQKRVCTAKNVVKVRNHFVETPKASLRKSSHVLGIKKTSLREILKKDLKMKPYKLYRSQELPEERPQKLTVWLLQMDHQRWNWSQQNHFYWWKVVLPEWTVKVVKNSLHLLLEMSKHFFLEKFLMPSNTLF